MLGPVLDDRDAGLGEGLVFRGQSSHRAFIYLADVTAIWGSYTKSRWENAYLYILITCGGWRRTGISTLRFLVTSWAGAIRVQGAVTLDFFICDASGGADARRTDTAVLQNCAVAYGSCFH